jgi:tetratricopeptide (TPR) repeat protein
MTLPILNNADISATKVGPTQTVQLPAYSAFSKGIVALESGNKNQAIQWFEFALLENPDSVESSIFLAETLYQQNRPEESSKHLQNVLDKENISAYNQATAANILSRISEQQGKFNDALRYAQKSGQAKVLGQCSVDFVEQRIHKLESEIAMSPIPSDEDQTNTEDNTSEPENYVRQCNELKNHPVETSQCQSLQNENVNYAMNIRKLTFDIT